MQREEGGHRMVVFLVGVLFLNLILMSSRIILKNDRSLLITAAGFVVTPVQVLFQDISAFLSRNLRHYVFVTNTFQRYQNLKREHSRLKYENYRLRRRLETLGYRERVQRNSPRFLAAELVFVDPNFPFNTVMVDRGSLQGVRAGMVVLNEAGELVGRVIDPVQVFASRIRLITSASGGVGAAIERDGMEGLVTGRNDRICEFSYLLENQPVQVGDPVVTSGTDGIYPPGLPLGRVIKVQRADLVQKVWVQPYFVSRPLKRMMIIRDAP